MSKMILDLINKKLDKCITHSPTEEIVITQEELLRIKMSFKQPQLSDDVEETIKLVNDLQINYIDYDENEMFEICCKLRDKYIAQSSEIVKLAKEKRDLTSRLNAIREVVYGGYQREEIEDKIKQILGDNS